MAWQRRDVMEQRIEFVVRASTGNECFSELCKAYSISRFTGYVWLNRYRESGSVSGLEDLSRRPKKTPHKTSEALEAEVIQLRKKYGWGGRKLRHVFLRDGKDLNERTINRIIKRHGLCDEKKSQRRALKRFQREKPNELWQMDFKGEYPDKKKTCYPFSLLDDHSRFLIGLYSLCKRNTISVEKSLLHAFENYGLPEAILTDHGTPWWCTLGEYGLTRLAIMLIKQGITLKLSGIRHPQTQGKVERFHRTLDEALMHRGLPKKYSDWEPMLNEIREEYNQVRPHEAIAMNVPADCYEKSPRQYNPKPSPWVYPYATSVATVDSAGCVRHKGSQYFMTKTLIGEKVSLNILNDKLIVGFRHMYVREIDLKTGRGKPILKT